MKVHIINHRCGDDEIEVKNGIRVFDWVGNEFIINLNNFGELEINKNRIYESGEKYDSTRFDRRIDACQG